MCVCVYDKIALRPTTLRRNTTKRGLPIYTKVKKALNNLEKGEILEMYTSTNNQAGPRARDQGAIEDDTLDEASALLRPRMAATAATPSCQDRRLSSPWLICMSALVAGLMDLQAGRIQDVDGVPGPVVTLSSGLVTMVLCTVVVAADGCPTASGAGWSLMSFQALLGGMLPHMAFFAIPLIGLAVAECIMFTMPLWTGIFTLLIDADAPPWGMRDYALALFSLTGVALIARPWAGDAAPPLVGLAAALGFAMCGGLLNVLIKATALRRTDPWLLGATQGGATFAVALILWAAAAVTDGNASTAEILDGMTTPTAARLFLIGHLFVLTNQTRTLGLQRARSTVVATLLYTQVAWGFLFDTAINGTRPAPAQYAGALLIVGASGLPPLLAEAATRARASAPYLGWRSLARPGGLQRWRHLQEPATHGATELPRTGAAASVATPPARASPALTVDTTEAGLIRVRSKDPMIQTGDQTGGGAVTPPEAPTPQVSHEELPPPPVAEWPYVVVLGLALVLGAISVFSS